MAVIEKQYTKFIFPFRFQPGQVDPTKARHRGSRNEIEVFEPFSQTAQYLREGLDRLLVQDGGSARIAECFRVCYAARKYFDLPNRQDGLVQFYCRQAEDARAYNVQITDLRVFLFESGVGVLEIECKYQERDIDAYINCNYFIAEVKSNKNYFTWTKKNGGNSAVQMMDAGVEHRFTMRDLVDRMLEAIGFTDQLAPLRKTCFFDERPIIFSHLLLDEKPENMDDLMKHAAGNCKHSYLLSEDTAPIRHTYTFTNSCWASTLKGVVNISHLTSNTQSNNFYRDEFEQRLKTTYYTLFLHIIHQKYATMQMLGKMGQLDRLAKDYSVIKEELRMARLCSAEAQNLKFRAFFRIPAEYEHINRVFEQMVATFRIKDLQDNFKEDMDNLQSICDSYVQRIKNREQKKKRQRACFVEMCVALFGTLVGEVTLINASWSIIEKVTGNEVSILSAPMVILMLTAAVPLITAVCDVIKRVAEIRALKEELKSELDDQLVEVDRAKLRRQKRKQKEPAQSSERQLETVG